MSERTLDYEDLDPTAVREMKDLLDKYERDVSRKLANLRESIRRGTPPPTPPPNGNAATEIPATDPAPSFDDVPTRRTKIAR